MVGIWSSQVMRFFFENDTASTHFYGDSEMVSRKFYERREKYDNGMEKG